MGADRIFIDTNILVYANQVRSPFHARASDALKTLDAPDLAFCVSRQVLREYYGAVTRPQLDEPALDPETASQRVEAFAELFDVLEENTSVLERLLTLARRYGVSGKQIHDANIVATMLEHGVTRILTANPADFRRFGDLIDIEPL